MNLEKTKELFITRCLAMELSDTTLDKYNKCLRRFHTYCQQQEHIKDIEDITPNHIRGYLVMLHDSMCALSLKSHYVMLKAYFNCLKHDKIIIDNPIESVSTPKVPVKVIPTFTKAQINTILNTFDKSGFIGYRNYTIMCFLFATGVRRMELAQLQLYDIDFDINTIHIKGKGNRERKIPMTISLRKTLVKYLHMRKDYINEKHLCTSPYLIISHIGLPLSLNLYSDMLHKLGEQEHITGVRVSPHTFRHTFAKYFLLNGGDIFTLQRLLGHSDISMTRKYVNLNDKELRIQNDKYNPFEHTQWQYY